MANSALIEDLRKQFAENPRRVFARLANEYRKSGDLDVAIEICRAHVPLQPTYISGYIVLGQALFERGQPEEARSTFETALTLDPENLIALRQLGDIARASGDLDAARGWYHKLLEVDPQNEEIAASLAELDAPTPTTASATPADASPVSWSDIHPDSPVVAPPPRPAASPAAPTPTAPSQPAPSQAARPRFTIGVIPENLAADPGAPAPAASSAPSAPQTPAASANASQPSDAPAPATGSVTLPEAFAGFDRHSPTPPTATLAVTAPEGAGEIHLDASEMTADSAEASVPELMDISDLAPTEPESANAELPPIATTAEFSVPALPTAPPATAAEIATLFAGPELETPREAESAKPEASADAGSDSGATFEEEPYDPTVGRMLELSSRTSSDALLPDLMMTESGAELLREQGHIDQAIYVYRHLAAKNPNDASYAERIAALERGAHSSIPLIASISQDIISAAKNRPYSTQNVRSFFTTFATRKAPDGEESQNDGSAAKTAEATLAAAAPEAAAPQTTAPEANQPEAAAQEAAPEAVAPQAPEPEAPAPTHEPTPPESVSDEDRSALETLFTGKPKVAATDERAAAALASAFSEEFTPETTGPAGQPTRVASDSLSLDAVFQSTRPRSDGDHRGSQPTVSFDEFFANRDNGNSATETKTDAAVETASLTDDSQSDLELFHEWLDGLKK